MIVKRSFSDTRMRALDTERASLWDVSDFSKVGKLIKLIKLSEKADKLRYIRNLESSLDRIRNDNRSTFFDDGSKFEPISVTKNENKVVNSGLILLSLLMSGEAFQVPLYLASGTGTEEVSEDQTTLSNENARNLTTDEGWRVSDGNSVKMGCRFDPNTPTADITEFGSFDSITGGNMEWRVVVDQLQHTQGSTFYMSYHSLNLNSR